MTCADPFGTAGLRDAVLRTWATSPARFREDANAEEHLALGYGGRVLAELAANAADAARESGAAGEIVIRLADGVLRVANTGAPLTADGMAALAALRASSKRGGAAVGHFGVGFTAVRELSDRPEVVSTTGGVRFSVPDTAAAITGLGVPALDEELRRREGQVPALRLPWPAPAASGLPAGCVTEVRLPLRVGVDPAGIVAQLTVETATDLLWALPDLAAVTMPGCRVARTVDPDDPGIAEITVTATGVAGPVPAGTAPGGTGAAGARRFRVLAATGTVPEHLLAGRPVEERARSSWQLAWVLAVDAAGRPDPLARAAIGAPTPTAEPLSLPAQLVGTLPVDESRSRIAPGPLTDFLVDRAADAYEDLVLALDPDRRPDLVPPVGFPLGDVDAAICAAVSDRLRRSAFLVGAAGDRLTPGRACLVSGIAGPAARCIAEAMPGLLHWPDSPSQVERLRGLGVGVEPLATVTAALAQLDRPAAFWQQVYRGLDGAPADQLADLPVPRRGGGVIVGPRGVLLAGGDGPAEGGPAEGGPAGDGPAPDGPAGRAGGAGTVTGSLADRAARLVPALRMAAAGADHPLLRRLGAEPADAAAIAADPAFAAEIRRRLDDLEHDDPDMTDLREFAGLALDLRDAGATAGFDGWADVLLTDTDGEPWPAGSLLLPGAPLAGLLAPDADLPTVGDDWMAEYGAGRLARLGVRAGLAARRYLAPPGPDTDLADVTAWAEQWPPMPGEPFLAVPDLDLIDDAAWPAALRLLASDRTTRDALRPTGTGPSYTAWWIAAHARVDGLPLRRWRAGGAAALAGLYDPLPVALPPDVAADLGLLATLNDAAREPTELLARWADPARPLAAVRVPEVTAALVGALASGPDVDLPAGVRTLAGDVVDADRAAVLDRAWLAQVLDPGVLVAGGADPQAVADALDLPVASQRYGPGFEVGAGAAATVTELGALDAAARCLRACGREDLAGRAVTVDPDLAVRAGTGEVPRRVGWWCDGERLLVDGSAGGIARAVAHLAGCWPRRHRLAALARGGGVELAEAGLD